MRLISGTSEGIYNEMKTRDYHCCASCKHFRVLKEPGVKVEYQCSRLGYPTKPGYRFDCWDPKDVVRKRMDVSS